MNSIQQNPIQQTSTQQESTQQTSTEQNSSQTKPSHVARRQLTKSKTEERRSKAPQQHGRYGVASISRLLKMIGLFCRILSLLWVSFAKETYLFKEPTNRSHPIVHSHTSRSSLAQLNSIKFISQKIWLNKIESCHTQAIDLEPEEAKYYNNMGGSLAAFNKTETAERRSLLMCFPAQHSWRCIFVFRMMYAV